MLLALDVGTSTTRAALVGEDGGIGYLARVPTPSSGPGVLSPEEVFEACLSLARLVLANSKEPLSGIGVTAQLGLVLADEMLRPTTDALLWNDRRATVDAATIGAVAPDVEEVTGRRPTGDLVGPKLRWLAREQPNAFAQARWALSLKDYLVAKLTGEVLTDESSASYSGLFDVRRRCWSGELLEAAGVEDRLLPTAAPACSAAGPLRRELAVDLDVGEDVVVAVGGPDGSMGVLGAGGVLPGIVVDVAGSTDVVLTTTDRPRSYAGSEILVNAHVLPGLWTAGGTTPTTGLALSWLARLLGTGSAAELLERHAEVAANLPVGCHGLLVDPALSGPRFPYEASARPAIVGLKLDHGAPELVRGFAEGIAFSVLEVLQLLHYCGYRTDRVRLVGGGSQGWTAQLRADAWQREVELMSCHEATLLGTALAAGVAAGAYPSPEAAAEHLVRTKRILEPRSDLQGLFTEAFNHWQQMKVALGARPFAWGDAEARRAERQAGAR